MSLLQEVIEEYCQEDKSSETPRPLGDKSAKTPSDTFGTEPPRHSHISKEPDLEPIVRIDWGESPLVQSVDKRSKELIESPDELQRAAEDDWAEVSNDPAQLIAFADSLAIVQIRESGGVPDTYVSVTTCQKCGTVPIFEGCPSKIGACVWCMNGLTAPAIPGVKE